MFMLLLFNVVSIVFIFVFAFIVLYILLLFKAFFFVLVESLDNIISKIDLASKVRIKYFKKDLYKDGGKYLYKVGLIKKIDEINKKIVFEDKEEINLNDIIDINIYKEI